MYYDQIKLLKKGVEKARGLLGDAIDVVPGLGTVNQGLLAAENIGRGNLAGAAENIQNLVPTGKIAGRAIKALTKGKGQSELSGVLSAKAPRQDALDLAQKRAALPVSEGGLGLPPDNTPMERAKAGGFIPAYHYSRADDAFDSFRLMTAGTNTSFLDGIGVHVGTQRAAEDRFNQYWRGSPLSPQGFTMPLMVKADSLLEKRGGETYTESELKKLLSNRAKSSGLKDPGISRDSQIAIRESLAKKYDAAPYINKVEGGGDTSMVIPDPGKIRSRFAAFDPFRFGENDLLAIQGGLLGTSQDSSILNRYETDADRRMEIARRNAALPVEQGGLGLPDDNTPMDRAKAMGFDVDNPLYHGTDKSFEAFDLSRLGSQTRIPMGFPQGIYTSPDASVAGRYGSGDGANVLKLLARSSNSQTTNVDGTPQEVFDRFNAGNIDAVKSNRVTVLKDPNQLRSVFAAFDLFRRNESDLLALQGGQYTPQDLLGFERMLGLLGE